MRIIGKIALSRRNRPSPQIIFLAGPESGSSVAYAPSEAREVPSKTVAVPPHIKNVVGQIVLSSLPPQSENGRQVQRNVSANVIVCCNQTVRDGPGQD